MKYRGMLLPLVAIALAALPLVSADWQFKSRPDLAPPRLNITIPATADIERGYLFLAPFAGFPDKAREQHGPRQAAPYIFRDNGDLVWSGYGYYSIWATNFQKARWNGMDVLFSFEGDHSKRPCLCCRWCFDQMEQMLDTAMVMGTPPFWTSTMRLSES